MTGTTVTTGTKAGTSAKRLRALVVEDEYLVAMLVEDMLAALGYQVVEIAQNLDAATHAAESGDFDVAVLDVNLEGAFSNPVADILKRRGIPFIFATGYGQAGPHETFEGTPALQKPFDEDGLRRALSEVMGGA